MIDDLDKTLESMLKANLPQDLVNQVAISFATPDDQFPPSSVNLPAIDLFLYDVRENRELRNNEWQIEKRDNGVNVKKPAPFRIECSYLITAWASESTPNPARDEHRILGEIMKVLLKYSTIPSEASQGSLKNNDLPIPTTVLQPGHLQSIGEFWQSLGGKPKAALHFTVTIGVDALKPLEVGPPVTEKMLKFGTRSSQ